MGSATHFKPGPAIADVNAHMPTLDVGSKIHMLISKVSWKDAEPKIILRDSFGLIEELMDVTVQAIRNRGIQTQQICQRLETWQSIPSRYM